MKIATAFYDEHGVLLAPNEIIVPDPETEFDPSRYMITMTLEPGYWHRYRIIARDAIDLRRIWEKTLKRVVRQGGRFALLTTGYMPHPDTGRMGRTLDVIYVIEDPSMLLSTNKNQVFFAANDIEKASPLATLPPDPLFAPQGR